MIVYHGSDVIVKSPDIFHSTRCLDFGLGFYVTSVRFQAERWAKRKIELADKKSGFVNIFEYDESSDYKIMDFGIQLDKWIDFVCACRDGSDIYKQYDVIKGKVANDKVFRVVNMYRRGFWDKAKTLLEIKAYDVYDQIAFISQSAIDSMLTYKDTYEVSL